MLLIFHELLVRPITNIMVAIYHGLVFLHVPYPLGFSIIVLTILIRFVLYPLTASQLKASRKMQQIAPHLTRVKEKHKGDNQKIQAETMRLYKEHGINPAAGCLPLILQLPIIWALYSVLQTIVGLNGHAILTSVNSIVYSPSLRLTAPWDQHFFGVPLGQNPSHLISTLPIILIVPLITGVLQFIQSKMMMTTPAVADTAKKSADDFSSAFQTQSLYVFPLMIGFFSYSFPIGLSLYWNTFTIFGILQQYQIQKSKS